MSELPSLIEGFFRLLETMLYASLTHQLSNTQKYVICYGLFLFGGCVYSIGGGKNPAKKLNQKEKKRKGEEKEIKNDKNLYAPFDQEKPLQGI